jgi:hypothetical protein
MLESGGYQNASARGLATRERAENPGDHEPKDGEAEWPCKTFNRFG